MADDNNGEIGAKLPYFAFSIKGKQINTLVVIAFLFGVVLLIAEGVNLAFTWKHSEAVTSSDAELRKETAAALGALKDGQSGILVEQRKTTEAQQELNYITTLSQEKREKLNLQMPDSLRKKLRRNGEP